MGGLAPFPSHTLSVCGASSGAHSHTPRTSRILRPLHPPPSPPPPTTALNPPTTPPSTLRPPPSALHPPPFAFLPKQAGTSSLEFYCKFPFYVCLCGARRPRTRRQRRDNDVNDNDVNDNEVNDNDEMMVAEPPLSIFLRRR